MLPRDERVLLDRVVPERLAEPADLARDAVDRLDPVLALFVRLAVPEPLLLLFEAPLPLFARDGVARALVPLAERELADLPDAELLEPDELERDPLDLDEEPPSSLHLPESTRCAASVIASAISEPSRVALDTAVVAAFEAASAASRPASRILRRAPGLALIAAAAAARPAASISRLIAALAILSTVSLDCDEPVEPVELFLVDFAIALDLPLLRERHFKHETVP